VLDKIKKWRNPRFIIPFALYAVTCAALYIIEHVMYAGAVATVYMYVLVYPPLFVIGLLIFGNRQLKKDHRKELRAKLLGMLGAMALVICIIVGYNFISDDNYHPLYNWQILSLGATVAVGALLEGVRIKNDISIRKVDYATIILAALLLTTAVFLLSTRPYTVTGAGNILSDHGHAGATLTGHHPHDSEYVPEGAGPLGAYLFTGISGENLWVDVQSGGIIE
jgi:peptidoglycan/LPS O-acetylase OafA/YrhL